MRSACPRKKVLEVGSNGKTKEVERKIFPGYVIVKMILTDESWYAVRNIRGCTGFVGPSSSRFRSRPKRSSASALKRGTWRSP